MSLLRTSAYLSTTAALAASALIVSGGGGASAALTTRCVGEASAVTVPGDLVVPAGAACVLYETTIQGSARVRPGGNLILREGSTVAGDLRLAPDAFADVSASSVQGSVIGRGPYGAVIDAGTVGGDIKVRPDDAFAGISFLETIMSDIGGSVTARSGEVLIESSSVGNALNTRGSEYTDIVDSTVVGDVSIRENAFGSLVCESEIYGNASFVRNTYGLQIGGDGALGPCDGATFWGGDLTINRNEGADVGIDVSNNIVAGGLAGDGNTPVPTGVGNRARNGMSGQFADLQPAPALLPAAPAPSAERSAAMASADAAAADEAPGRDAQEQITARRTSAEANAREAGPANLVP